MPSSTNRCLPQPFCFDSPKIPVGARLDAALYRELASENLLTVKEHRRAYAARSAAGNPRWRGLLGDWRSTEEAIHVPSTRSSSAKP